MNTRRGSETRSVFVSGFAFPQWEQMRRDVRDEPKILRFQCM